MGTNVHSKEWLRAHRAAKDLHGQTKRQELAEYEKTIRENKERLKMRLANLTREERALSGLKNSAKGRAKRIAVSLPKISILGN